MKRIVAFILLIAAAVTNLTAWGQRRVTPVNNASTATQAVNQSVVSTDSLARRNVVEMTDAQGRRIYVDTIAGTEWVDSAPATRKIPRMEQPLLYAASVSVDVASPLMRVFGRKYGISEVAAAINLHNRYIPTLEIGVGQACNTPDGGNYTYRSDLSAYFRIGADYNFIYNSNPDYMFFAGVRYGLSPFSWSVTDVTPVGGNYWGQQEGFSIAPIKSTIGYFQFLLGLRVKIAGPISLGWTLRWQSMIHQSKSIYGEPWYIPGYGTRGSSLNFTFAVTYTLKLKNKTSISIPTNDDYQGK